MTKRNNLEVEIEALRKKMYKYYKENRSHAEVLEISQELDKRLNEWNKRIPYSKDD
ncbi:aspartyl-phosphate phosphatase Spo0E family protein [Thalassobacillus hwangdonensis]|uniref:Aspartyl-phosphate phosphatase Spo0E family protein n=1 Tax=Thalassobacillus hwangdonensis TaxID=546108 RepID=A0ABW3L2L1_9BACI